jgi:hypothetical protein
MRRALHLGVQKSLGVVASHYQVNLEAIYTGYVIPVGIDDEVAMNRVDTLVAPAPTSSPKTSWSSCFPMLLRLVAPRPESSWVFKPYEPFG